MCSTLEPSPDAYKRVSVRGALLDLLSRNFEDSCLLLPAFPGFHTTYYFHSSNACCPSPSLSWLDVADIPMSQWGHYLSRPLSKASGVSAVLSNTASSTKLKSYIRVKNWPHTGAPQNPTDDRPPAWCNPICYNPLSLTLQPVVSYCALTVCWAFCLCFLSYKSTFWPGYWVLTGGLKLLLKELPHWVNRGILKLWKDFFPIDLGKSAANRAGVAIRVTSAG